MTYPTTPMDLDIDPASLRWRKSSYSGQQGGDCVEVATTSDRVLVRDSKNPDGARLAFTSGEWGAFVAGIRAGEFDLT